MTFPPDLPETGDQPTRLGSFVRRRREQLGLTQELLAEAAHLSFRSISDIELGRSQSPQRRTIDLLSDGLQLSEQQRQQLRTLVPQRSHPKRRNQRLPASGPPEPARVHHLKAPATAAPPWPDSPLIGRQELIGQLVEIISGPVRLVTLTGPPGVGKTRIAVELARHPVLAAFVDAVAFVPLAESRSVAEAIGRINAVLGITVSSRPAPISVLRNFLQRGPLLLVLDNVEQIPQIDSLLADLVDRSPHVRILVTSRHRPSSRLGREVVIPPLALPEPGSTDQPGAPDPDTVTSVAFILERLEQSGVRIRLTAAVMADIAEICRLTDGLPLALALATARLRAMSPGDLLTQIRARDTLPFPDPDATHDRHRSLRSAIGWSVDLLSPEARDALAWLSVFSGGFTSEAAERVLRSDASSGTSPSRPVVSILEELVDQHLLASSHSAPDDALTSETGGRYSLLETIHDVATSILQQSNQADAAHEAHAAWCWELAEVAERALQGAAPGNWLRRLDREIGNIREATVWLAERASSGEPEAAVMGLDLSARLWHYWRVRGLSDEGQYRIERAIEVAEPLLGHSPHPSWARALNNLGILVMDTGDTERTRALFETSLVMSRAIGDGRDIADTVNNLGVLSVYHGNYLDAQQYHLEAYRLRLPLGEPQRLIYSIQNLGDIALDTHLPELAIEFHTEGIRIACRVGDETNAAYGFISLGEAATDEDQTGSARRYLTKALNVFEEVGDQLGLGFVANAWGYLAHQQGDHRAALAWQKRALDYWQKSNNRRGQVGAVEASALALFELGRMQVAADLLASAERIRADERMGRPPKRTPPLQRAIDALERDNLVALDTFATPMALDQVVALTMRIDAVQRRTHRPHRVRPSRLRTG